MTTSKLAKFKIQQAGVINPITDAGTIFTSVASLLQHFLVCCDPASLPSCDAIVQVDHCIFEAYQGALEDSSMGAISGVHTQHI